MTVLVSSQWILIPFRYYFISRIDSGYSEWVQEYTKRPRVQGSDTEQGQRYHPRHVVRHSNLSLQECLALSDVVVSAVPSASYKVKTEWLKDGCVCLNVAADKNFEKDVRDKVNNTWERIQGILS